MADPAPHSIPLAKVQEACKMLGFDPVAEDILSVEMDVDEVRVTVLQGTTLNPDGSLRTATRNYPVIR